MKYLVEYLEGLSDGPRLSDPDFQHLLLEVEAGKSQARSSDAFYENLEKVVTELRTSPESLAFQKPVSKREAPDYYDVIKRPMDLSTILRNIKAHKYKSKAEFEAELNLIWDNCFTYNTNETHPIRNAARTMKQKADYFLSFVIDKNEKAASSIAALLPPVSAAGPSQIRYQSPTASGRPSAAPGSPTALNVESADDAAHRSTNGEPKQFFRAGEARARSRGASEGSRAGSIAREGEASTSSGRNKRDASGRRSVSRARSRQAFSAAPHDTERSINGLAEQGEETDFGAGSASDAGPGPASSFRAQQQSLSAISQEEGQAQAGSDTNGIGPPDPLDRAESVRHAASAHFRLSNNLEQIPDLTRTPWSLTALQSVSLSYPTLTWSDKGKAREVLASAQPPEWFTVQEVEDEESQMEAKYWGLLCRDEAYLAGLPAVPTMCAARPPPRRKIPSYKRRRISVPNGDTHLLNGHASDERDATPALSPERKSVDLSVIMEHTAENLEMTRTYANKIADWQRAEADGGLLPGPVLIQREEKAAQLASKQARADSRKLRRDRAETARARRAGGGEMSETLAASEMRRAAGMLLAHAGFEGANESALDLFTRIATDQITSLGRTLRLLSDGFSQKMSSEDLVLHALYENGNLQTYHIETYIKDEVERENGRIKEALRKMRQAHREVTTAPVIQDDMLIDGDMLLDGNFADELGEDFLGLRDLGIDKEEGLASLTIPSAIFYGRRKRQGDAAGFGAKEDVPDFPPPPPFVALSPSTVFSHIPDLLRAFYDQRLQAGITIAEDDPFDQVHSQIGALGQVVVKDPPKERIRKRKEANGEADGAKKSKKALPGVGRGNWTRPPKEERDRRAAEKKAEILKQRSSPVLEDAAGEDEDAEGEEE